MNSWKTTLIGILGAITTYIVGIGGKLPTTRNEWVFFIFSLISAGLGLVAKDSNVTGGTVKATNLSGDPLKPTK